MDYEPTFLAPLVFAIFLVLLVKGVRRVLLPRLFVEKRRLKGAKAATQDSQSIVAMPSNAKVQARGLLFIVAAPLLLYLTGVQAGIATTAASSATDSQLRRLVATSAEQFVNQNSLVNLAVVAVADGKTEIVCIGQRSLLFGEPVNESTLFEIGSVTKTFTGLLLAQNVVRKEVDLDDPVASLLPQSLALPGKTRESITLRQLASHTSGLRGVPPGSSTSDEFFAELAQTKLASEPGAEMVYSNMGASLLGYALSRAQGSYEATLRAAILEPLGMGQTTSSVNHKSQQPRGYGSAYRLGPFVFARCASSDMYGAEPFAGMGAIKSNPADMLKYLKAQMGLSHGPLDSAIILSHAELFRMERAGRIGMFWMLPSDSGIIWHSGQTRGFRTFMAFSSDRRFGIVVMTATRRSVEALGLDLLKRMRQQS